MNLGVLKKLIQNLPDDTEVSVEQTKEYICNLVLITPSTDRDKSILINVLGIDFTPKESED
jgi:hypothetical protein